MSEPAASALIDLEDLRDLYENAPCGYLSMMPDGRIFKANATLSRWIGIPREDIIGKRLLDLLTTPGRIFYETNLAPLLRLRGAFEEVALDFVTSTGEKLPVLVNAQERRDAHGAALFSRVGVFRAKDRLGYERDLRGRETAALKRLSDEQQIAELREQFIAVLGHDLRNPLASILGAARLLRREVQSEKALHILQLMETSVDRMAGLIDDVMDFARGRLGGGIELHRRVAQLEPVLRQVAAEIEASDPSRIILCDLALPRAISFDERRIGQLASNLLTNAFTHGNPKTPVRLEAYIDDDRFELSVTNSGKAIPPAAMERLFQPFFRGEVRSSHDGLGLGLHIASEIAKAHGGMLGVESDENETKFTFTMTVD